MDQDTRNKLQRATQQVRRILEEEFAEQLEGTFDVLADGTIAEKPGAHLDATQRLTRQKLVQAIGHLESGGKNTSDAIEEYLRQAAFTILNRFVALRMLEARDLLQECVSKGDDSSGFREFCGLAPGLSALPDDGYRLYLECLCDELTVEIKVLFDRRDPTTLLWPRRSALTAMLDVLAQPELADVWAEDETIGWVYQYFNGDEERTQMRKESQAPRNSRELAVRNQFFTPRYVVQFLTDNTLGRTWYEMMQGDTQLAHLDYLVRRPNEAFLAEGESAPESDTDDSELSQEELLQQTVHVPFRKKKDPRDLRILDPACGSGHFLLYTFDLLITIYEEAWADAGAATLTETGTQLRADYESIEDLRRAMPELILRHNLHGVDIDPRAAQIAALALWMRAQRAYNQFEVDRAQRPPITKTNIVVAEPMPGDAELVDEFAASLKPAVLGDLFKKMVEEMQLAGELGSLLKIEESIAKAVKEAEEAHRKDGLFAEKIESQDFWDTADEAIIAALGSFAESAAGAGGVRRQLFAGDAAQGVAFIELMRKRFDAVLMNPPFGLPTDLAKLSLKKAFTATWKDLYSSFLVRGTEVIDSDGKIGAITPATFLNLFEFRHLREILLEEASPSICVDLRYGVMDHAVVPVACSVISSTQRRAPVLFIDARFDDEKRQTILGALDEVASKTTAKRVRVVSLETLRSLPNQIFAYQVSPEVRSLLTEFPTLGERAKAAFGLHTHGGDDIFFRAWWEVPTMGALAANDWPTATLGDKPHHFFRSHYYVVDWRNNGQALKELAGRAGGGTLVGRKHYFKPGLGYLYVSRTTFSVQPIPSGSIFTAAAHGLFPNDGCNLWLWLGWLNSEPVRCLAKVINPNRFFQSTYVEKIPFPDFGVQERNHGIEAAAKAAYEAHRCHAEGDECSLEFGVDWVTRAGRTKNSSPFEAASARAAELRALASNRHEEINQLITAYYSITKEDLAELGQFAGKPTGLPLPGKVHLLENGIEEGLFAHLSVLVGLAFGRWNCSFWRTEEHLAPLPGAFEALPRTQRAANAAGRAVDILVNDAGHDDDLGKRLGSVVRKVWSSRSESVEREMVELLAARVRSDEPISDWLRSKFFSYHVSRYTLRKRKAPIYWQLATPSASYSVWCYYHRLTRDTFFRVANEYVTPKVDHEERKLNTLRQEAGSDPSSKQRKEIDAQETFVAELRAFLTEVKRIAPLWNPNLNDGVIINFAPLWRLVPQHKAWQKECKKVWDKLVKGDYDWAHLAMHLWPERVVPKCQDDRSLAIAHGLEDDFWAEDKDEKWEKRKPPEGGWESVLQQLIDERTSPEVKAALNSLMEAPTPGGSTTGTKRRRKAGAS